MKKYFVTISLVFGILTFAQKNGKSKIITTSKKTVNKSPVIVNKESDSVKIAEKLPEIIIEKDTPEKYEILSKKILEKNGWINNRNSEIVRGIEGFVKGVYVGDKKIFVLLEIANRTNINYDIESISFITSPIQNSKRQLEAEEKIFMPIYSNQPENLPKKSAEKLIFVFDKFNISDNKTLLFIMNEIDGERTLTLEIKPKYIIEAEYIK